MLIIEIALSVYAIHVILNEHPLFKRLIVFCDFNLPEVITKPLYGCPMCMCMTWGVVLYFLPFALPLTILSTMALIRIYADNL